MARKTVSKRAARVQAIKAARPEVTAIYIRVSTKKQEDEGYSLTTQLDDLTAHCTQNGWAVTKAHTYVDAGVSGTTDDRPAYTAMLLAAEEGKVDRIVTTKIDRLARNLANFLDLVKKLDGWGCSLVIKKEGFDTSTAAGRFTLQLFAAVAEMEASTITERVMSGKGTKAKEGGYNGSRVPYGYRYTRPARPGQTGTWTVEPSEAEIVQGLFISLLEGATLTGMAETLNSQGIPSPRGKQWSKTAIKGMLLNGVYAGIALWNGVEIDEGYTTPIVDRATYEAANVVLNNMKQGNPYLIQEVK